MSSTAVCLQPEENELIILLEVLNQTARPETEEELTEGRIVTAIRQLAASCVLTKYAEPNYALINDIESRKLATITCLEADSLGWRIAVLKTTKGSITFQRG